MFFFDTHVTYVPVLFVHKRDDVMCGFFCNSSQLVTSLIKMNHFDFLLVLFLEGPVFVGLDTPYVIILATHLLYPVYMFL